MKRIKNRPILLAVVVGLAVLYAMMGTMGAAPVQAFDPMGSGIEILVFDNDHVTVPLLDDRGNFIGYADEHSGEVLCSGSTCSDGMVLR